MAQQIGFVINDSKPMNKKDLTTQISVVSIQDKYSSYPSSGLTPEKLARIFREADQGDIYRQMELFEEMEEKDTHLFSILQTRKNAVLGLEWDIMPYSEAPEDIKKADFIRKAFEFEDLESSMLDLLDAIGKGFAVCENIYKVENDKVYIDHLEWVHQKKFIFDDAYHLKLITEDAPTSGIDLPPGKFTIHKYKARSGYPTRAGILRVCAWMYLFKNYSIKDWVTFAEVYGMPLRLGKYDASTTEEDKEALINAVRSLGTDAAGIISKSTEIEFIEAIRGSSNIYQTLAEFCNAEMSKAVLGQTLTTEVGARGSYAASQTHAEVRQDLLEADCKALAETFRKYIIKPLILYNFGDTSNLPWVKFHYEPPEDLKSEAEIYSTLIKDAGLPVSAEHMYEKFGIPKPKPGELIVTPGMSIMPSKYIPRILTRSKGQKEVDLLADNALNAFQQPFNDSLNRIINGIQQARSFEEVQDILTQIYGELNTQDMENILSKALYIADLFGRMMVVG
ncbi:MAG: hypothetical protein PWQ97_456 [Tepidanaerobacteraceae bacterium]|nr:hypothetical protein [Tepidanaerobacteraceae bacterium]